MYLASKEMSYFIIKFTNKFFFNSFQGKVADLNVNDLSTYDITEAKLNIFRLQAAVGLKFPVINLKTNYEAAGEIKDVMEFNGKGDIV